MYICISIYIYILYLNIIVKKLYIFELSLLTSSLAHSIPVRTSLPLHFPNFNFTQCDPENPVLQHGFHRMMHDEVVLLCLGFGRNSSNAWRNRLVPLLESALPGRAYRIRSVDEAVYAVEKKNQDRATT